MHIAQLTWAGLGQLCEMPNLRTLNCAGVKWTSDYSQSLTLPCLLKKLNSLIVGDTCTLSFVDDSLMALIATHSWWGRGCGALTTPACAGAACSLQGTAQAVLNFRPSKDAHLMLSSPGIACSHLSKLDCSGCIDITDAGVWLPVDTWLHASEHALHKQHLRGVLQGCMTRSQASEI